MKRLLFIAVLLAALSVSQQLSAQVNYMRVDSLAVTTSETDTTYSDRWYILNITFRGCNGLVKFYFTGADTSTASPWYVLKEDETLYFEKNDDLGLSGVSRIKVKASSGSGAVFLAGLRRR